MSADGSRNARNTQLGVLAPHTAPLVYTGSRWEFAFGGAAIWDAFGRQRISEPTTLFDSKLLFDASALVYDDAETSGGGTGSSHSANQAAVTLTATASTAGTRVRQSKVRPNYQPGKSQLSFITFVMGAAATGITRRVGLFDAQNGIFLEQTETAVNLVIRNYYTGSAVNDTVARADWNVDTFSDLDLSKAQILVIDYEWLGVGTVRVGFVIDGAIRWAHIFHHANSVTGVYMSNPNLPVRYELVADGTNDAASLVCICASVSSEGGSQFTGFTRTIDRGITGLTTAADTNIYPLIAVRLKSTGLNARVAISELGVFCNSTADTRWALLLNPTVAGTALSFSSVANSPVEAQVNTTNATTVTDGTLLASGYTASTNQISLADDSPSDYVLGSKIDGTSDIVVLAAQNLTAGAEVYFASMSWRETV